ncbi:sorting nexin-25-like isoform X2 [Pollicipes pollicipes]|uniref:sorting nexin-25-like isoform X2 n=1 Tax=Pollicipes pollicipes TaxID=41117 RepID=UPI001885963D|nr:sorting nexin-25-like isoform X2 [Pollicipes pollicipes]
MRQPLLALTAAVVLGCVLSSWSLEWWPRLLFGIACVLSVLVGAVLAVWVHLKLGKLQKVPVKRPVPVDLVKNILKSASKRDNTESYQRPPIISRSVDEVIAEIVNHVVEDFFTSWYSQLASEPEAQAELIKNELWESLRRLRDRLSAIDEVNFIATNVFNKIKQHFQRIRIAHEMSDGKTTLPMYTLVSYLANPERELQFLRSVAEVVIMILLPADYSRCVPVRQLLREILACQVMQPTVDLLCDPDFINQKVYEYVHHHQLWRELHQRTYTYAASYEDFIRIIQESNDVDELKHIRFNIVTEIMQATTINNLKRARGMKLTRDLRPQSASKGDLLQARNLKRYINQLTYAKTQCEKRIKSVGGMGYLTEIDSPESSDSQLIGRKVLSFGVIMESAYARRYLLRYLESEGQENLLLFWNAVNELRTCRKQLMHALGAEIYQTYLAGKYGVIRLDKVSLKRIESFLIGDRGPEIFLELQDEVQSQLEHTHYHRFLVSPLYNKMMLDAEEAGIDFINATVALPDDHQEGLGAEVGDTNLSDHSSFARLKLDQLTEKLRTKSQALEAMRSGTRPDLKMVSTLEQEVENLAGERRELEAHIERTDVWTQHLGHWTADVHSAEVLEEKDVPVFVLVVYLVAAAAEAGETSSGAPEPASPDDPAAAKRPLDSLLDNQHGWVVIRRLTDLLHVHSKLSQISPALKAAELPPLPSKSLFSKGCDRDFLERAKIKVQSYLTMVLADQRLNKSEVIYTFLSPSPEHLLFPGTSQKKFTFFSMFKGSGPGSDEAGVESDEDDILFLDGADTRPEVRDDFAEPLYGLIAEVFDLSGKWLRKTLMSFVQITYGRTISRQIRDMLSWGFSEPQLLFYLTTLREACWPGGKLAPPRPARSEQQMASTRQETRELLVNNVPELLTNLLGLHNSRLGGVKAFETLQDVRLNKHLFYTILESFITELFPEVGSKMQAIV